VVDRNETSVGFVKLQNACSPIECDPSIFRIAIDAMFYMGINEDDRIRTNLLNRPRTQRLPRKGELIRCPINEDF